jgi:uncharacterized protein YndB with AHSA1/START domain
MSENVDGYRIQVRASVGAPLPRVFAAWTDPALLVQWYPEMVSGAIEAGATTRFEWGSLGIAVDLDVRELVPGERIVFEGDTGRRRQRQTITFEPEARGTRLIVEHAGLASPDDAAGSESGWTIGLAVLREYLEHHFGRTRASFAVLGSARGSRAAIRELLAKPTWLAERVPRLRSPGAPLALVLLDGSTITGEVIAATGDEVALRCDEIAGVLALRAFPAGPGVWIVGAQVSSWGGADTRNLHHALIEGVERLTSALPAPSA